ncbi:MAG: hypothetical protein M9894_13420 [Planctomycetes bacterium]|nr:hypothetical protein [Planctomycetota bacterium]
MADEPIDPPPAEPAGEATKPDAASAAEAPPAPVDAPASEPASSAAPEETGAARDPGEPTPPGGIPRAFGGDEDALDIARGEVTDEDLDGLEAAIDSLDFATRKAAPARQTRLEALVARLQDVTDQIRQGVRRAAPDRQPLTEEQQARYQALVDEGVAAGEGGDLPAARGKLEEAARLDPDGIDALFNLGVVYGLIAHREIAKGEFYDDYVRDEVFVEKAKICYDRVLEREPRHMASLKNLATLYAMREERDLARDYLRRLLEVAPQDDGERQLLEEARQQLAELGAE